MFSKLIVIFVTVWSIQVIFYCLFIYLASLVNEFSAAFVTSSLIIPCIWWSVGIVNKHNEIRTKLWLQLCQNSGKIPITNSLRPRWRLQMSCLKQVTSSDMSWFSGNREVLTVFFTIFCLKNDWRVTLCQTGQNPGKWLQHRLRFCLFRLSLSVCFGPVKCFCSVFYMFCEAMFGC